MKPIRTVKFTHKGRAWIARLWPNSEGEPKQFWNLTPADQELPAPDWAEHWEAQRAFSAWLNKQPESVA